MAVAEMILNYTIAQGVTRTAFGRFQPVTPVKITLVDRLLCAQEQPVV